MLKKRRKKIVQYAEPYIGWRPSLVIEYGISNFGFGEISFVNTKDRPHLLCDSEFSGKDTIKKITSHLVNNSLFSQCVTTEKKIKKITLKTLNKMAVWGNAQYGFVRAFHHESADGISQFRWRQNKGNVVNVWVKEELLKRDSEGNLPNIISFSHQASKIGLGAEFIKAELWSWVDTPNNPDNIE